MPSLSEFDDTIFPNYPDEYLTETGVRQAYAKASAYVTIALDTAEVSHSRSQEAAAVTDATYELAEDKTPTEYLELAAQELAFAEGELPTDSSFRNDLQNVRTHIQQFL